MQEQELLAAIHSPDSANFKQLITCLSHLMFFTGKFPQHVDALIQKVLQDPNEFKRLIKSHSDLIDIVEQLPQYAQDFIQHADAMIHEALQDPVSLNPELRHILCLLDMGELFPHHANTLIQRILTNYADFKLVTVCFGTFIDIAKQFPLYAGDLIQVVLRNHARLHNFLSHDCSLKDLKEQFPQHSDIFGQSSRDMACKVLQQKNSAAEVRKNARLFYQIYQTKRVLESNFIKRLPRELMLNIAGFTANPETHTRATAEKIAHINFCRPI